MGAASSRTTTTRMESPAAPAPAPAAAAAEVGLSPKLRRPETFEEKFYRKFTQEPLVPIGCLITAYFLSSGISSFYKRDAQRSQLMMRARVAAQFGTLAVFMGYYGMDKLDFRLAPMYQDATKKQKTQSPIQNNNNKKDDTDATAAVEQK